MIDIVPAVMPESFEDLREKLARVAGIVPFVQIDVMDGIFVDSNSWPYIPGGPQQLAEYSKEKEGLPFWSELSFEIDLMVSDPETVIDDWVRAGASRVIVHIESISDMDEFIKNAQNILLHDTSGIAGIEFGLALNTTTPNEAVEPYLEEVNLIQCMGIEKIGYQGEPFDERVLDKVRKLKKRKPDLIVSVDGGVSVETVPLLVNAGADILVSGSTIFQSDDIVKAIEDLKNAQ